MKKILILSDTHDLLRDEVLTELAAADVVIHAGDVTNDSVLKRLKEYGNIYLVRGNNDSDLADQLPERLTLCAEGVRFLVVHNQKDVPEDLTGIDIVVYGHSHQYEAKKIGSILWLNPGSCGKRRFRLDITYCRMTADQGSYRYEKVIIE